MRLREQKEGGGGKNVGYQSVGCRGTHVVRWLMLMCTQGPGRPASTDTASTPTTPMLDYLSTFICCNTCWTRHQATVCSAHKVVKTCKLYSYYGLKWWLLNIEIFPVVVAEGCGVLMLCLEWSRGRPHLLPPPGRPES